MRRIATLSVIVLVAGSCAMPGGGPSSEERRQAAAVALNELAGGDFDQARASADGVLQADPGNGVAAAVRAIAAYVQATSAVRTARADMNAPAQGDPSAGMERMRKLATDLHDTLGRVQEDVAVAARDPDFSLELCIACFRGDWDGDGTVDDRDRALLQVDFDAQGEPLPDRDARRRPTFRFDAGDTAWAQAALSFQRASLSLLLAYRWEDAFMGKGHPEQGFVVALAAPERVTEAKRLILEGLAFAEAARQAYMAEKDDDREWVPGPHQKDHPLPMPVDAALYATWGDTLSDLERLLEGAEGLRVADLSGVDRARLPDPPAGFISVAALFDRPRAIELDLAKLGQLDSRTKEGVEAALDLILKDAYVDEMPASPLPARLARMRREIDAGQETLALQLSYLAWLN